MPENTEKSVKDTEKAVKADKPAKTEKSDKKENGTLFIPIPGMKTKWPPTWKKPLKTVSCRI